METFENDAIAGEPLQKYDQKYDFRTGIFKNDATPGEHSHKYDKGINNFSYQKRKRGLWSDGNQNPCRKTGKRKNQKSTC